MKVNKDKKVEFNPTSSIKSKSSFENFSIISMKILSTWGNNESVGLTEIQLLDNKFKKINIIECHIYNGEEEGLSK
jgi:hypothetical protein